MANSLFTGDEGPYALPTPRIPARFGTHHRKILPLHTMPVVGREYTVEACQVDSWRGRQSGQSGDKVQGLKDHMGGASVMLTQDPLYERARPQ